MYHFAEKRHILLTVKEESWLTKRRTYQYLLVVKIVRYLLGNKYNRNIDNYQKLCEVCKRHEIIIMERIKSDESNMTAR